MAAQVYVIAGLGFGDEGKGGLVDFLCQSSNVHSVIRYNGGAQAAHNVVLPDGTHHTFAQFGSGTLAGAKTHLSRFMLVNPLFLETEARHLVEIGVKNPQDLLTIDEEALITNPFQVAASRIRELMRIHRHGSCGMGIGETVLDSLNYPTDALRAHHLKDSDTLFEYLSKSRDRKLDMATSPSLYPAKAEALERECSIIRSDTLVDELIERYRHFYRTYEVVKETYLASLLDGEKNLVFEGAQGTLLDENYGFYPYTTWSNTTFANAKTLLNRYPAKYVGVLRAYHTRHGAGPFPTEDSTLKASGDHNGYGPWQHAFRAGHFDMVLAQYAQQVMECDELAVTCLDHVEKIQVCESYVEGELLIPTKALPKIVFTSGQEHTQGRNTGLLCKATPKYLPTPFDPKQFLGYVELGLGVPVTITSHGPTWQDKQCR